MWVTKSLRPYSALRSLRLEDERECANMLMG